MKNVSKPLGKSILIPLGVTAAASAGVARVHKKFLGPGKHILGLALPKQNNTKILIISNDEMEDIITIVKSLEDSRLLLVSETIQNEDKDQKFRSMLLGTLVASLVGNTLANKGVIKVGNRVIRQRQCRGVIRAGSGSTIKNRNF